MVLPGRASVRPGAGRNAAILEQLRRGTTGRTRTPSEPKEEPADADRSAPVAGCQPNGSSSTAAASCVQTALNYSQPAQQVPINTRSFFKYFFLFSFNCSLILDNLTAIYFALYTNIYLHNFIISFCAIATFRFMILFKYF